RLDSAEQRGDPSEQMLDADALRQVVVGTEAQARYRVELALASGQKDDRQLRRPCAQRPAELEAALDLRAEVHVDDHEIGQAGIERGERLLARRVAGDAIPLAPQRRGIVVAN